MAKVKVHQAKVLPNMTPQWVRGTTMSGGRPTIQHVDGLSRYTFKVQCTGCQYECLCVSEDAAKSVAGMHEAMHTEVREVE